VESSKIDFIWPIEKGHGISWKWRAFQVTDARKKHHHVIAIGIDESGDPGNERIDLVAYLLQAEQFSDWKERTLVCEMSARRTFGVKLTDGFVIVEQDALRSLNIGSLCFNETVKWARRVAPNDQVHEINLLPGVEATSPNLQRRLRFYQRFGLAFDFAEKTAPLLKGASREILARHLIELPMDAFPNIVEIDLVCGIQKLAGEREKFADEDARKRGILESRRSEESKLWRYARNTVQLLNWPALIGMFTLGAVIARPEILGRHWW
jgi:hypothetical protein